MRKTSTYFPDGVECAIDSFHQILRQAYPDILGTDVLGKYNSDDVYAVGVRNDQIVKANYIYNGDGYYIIGCEASLSDVGEWRFRGESFVGGGSLINRAIEKNGKLAYYCISLTTSFVGTPPVQIESNDKVAELAWTIVYGEDVPDGSPQTIPVQWLSPYNSKTLSDSFDIIVKETT